MIRGHAASATNDISSPINLRGQGQEDLSATNGILESYTSSEDFGIAKRITGQIAAALCAACTMWAGTVSATLIGDTVTVGHYSPDNATPTVGLGATLPSSFAVVAGSADVYTFYDSHPFGYTVNVEASTIIVDFSSVIQPGETGTWAADYQSCSFIPTFACTTVLMSFNGLGVSGLNDSSGNPLQSVLVSTNMVSWDSSRLAFGNDYVQFDWKGLSFTEDTRFTATLEFGAVTTPVPEPEIYAMLGLGLGLMGWAGRRRKLKESALA